MSELPRTVKQLLRANAHDTDIASIWVLGDTFSTATGAIIVIKGGDTARWLHDLLVRQKLLTDGKPICSPMPI